MRGKNVALIIHPLDRHGGAEKHLKVISDLYPDATIFTAWYDPEFVKGFFGDRKIEATFMQSFPHKKKFSQEYTPLLPFAYRSIDLSGFKKVLVLSDGFEKVLKIPKGTKLAIEVLTPPRFLWMETRSTQQSSKLSYKLYNRFLKQRLHRRWKKLDTDSVKKADLLLANSIDVQARISRFYGVHSEVLYPPVEIEDFELNPNVNDRENWFLYFGRIETYKGVEIAVRACITAEKKIKIAGKGADLERIKDIVRSLNGDSYVEFLGFVSEEEKKELYRKAKALVYPVKDEDFGIVPLEASASGCPVIAFNGGGVKETVIDNKTGILFKEYTVNSLRDALDRIDHVGISSEDCAKQANKFKREVFESKLLTFMNGLS
jgi:glycosyltransferase involved in cell wall biosynthesis